MTAKRFSHASAVTQAGFTIIPNAVMLRGDLSPTAKLVYGYLKHLAWRNDDADGVDPPREQVSADLHLSGKTVTASISELRAAPLTEGGDAGEGCLVRAVRRGQGRTNVYVIADPSEPQVAPQKGGSRKVGSTLQEGEDLPDPARARSSPSSRRKPTDAYASGGGLPETPPIWLDDERQNLPLNALVEELRIDEASPRLEVAASFLSGGSRVGRGIRDLFWLEINRYAAEHEQVDRDRLAALTPEAFAVALARAIHKRAGLYREAMPGATLSARALRDHWLDVLKMEPQPRRSRRRGMTADAVRRMQDA